MFWDMKQVSLNLGGLKALRIFSDQNGIKVDINNRKIYAQIFETT